MTQEQKILNEIRSLKQGDTLTLRRDRNNPQGYWYRIIRVEEKVCERELEANMVE